MNSSWKVFHGIDTLSGNVFLFSDYFESLSLFLKMFSDDEAIKLEQLVPVGCQSINTID